ncbi:MAG: hypothetical protein FWH20_06290 [Oscillospiraceae bacterium]|nr:hypothetical protein [Oscillospiraceae bacterium]
MGELFEEYGVRKFILLVIIAVVFVVALATGILAACDTADSQERQSQREVAGLELEGLLRVEEEPEVEQEPAKKHEWFDTKKQLDGYEVPIRVLITDGDFSVIDQHLKMAEKALETLAGWGFTRIYQVNVFGAEHDAILYAESSFLVTLLALSEGFDRADWVDVEFLREDGEWVVNNVYGYL